jgi:hypothetical protein
MNERDLYIYYQVAEADAAILAGRVRAMQAQLGRGQLKRRPGAADGCQTWMEIYTGVDPAFDSVLDAAVIAARLPEYTAGARHVEVFTDLDPVKGAPCA